MISQVDKFREGPLAETEIHVPPPSSEDRALSRLNQNFRLSKAQQILRLLKDQDELNQRFRECALLDEDENAKSVSRRPEEGDPDNRNGQEEDLSDGDGSDTSENEAERRAARRVALRKHRNSIDPGRCKTSMGFHNHAEVTEIPYDTDSDNVAGLDSACSTPRGNNSGALSARQPAHPNLYGPANGVARGSNNSRMRVYHLKIGENDQDVDLSEGCVVQSARSSRPKTSLTSTSNSRSRYYRQQPHPDTHHKFSEHGHHHHHHHHHHSHSHNHHSRQHGHQHGHQHSHNMGDTRQAIISRLDPHHPMAVRPFCENQNAQEDVSRTQSSSKPTTPRGGVPAFPHTEVTLFDMAPTFSKESTNPRPSSRRSVGSGLQKPAFNRTPSFTEHQRVTPASRSLLSVNSSPMQLSSLSPRGLSPRESPSSPRRLKPTRVKKRVGDVPLGTVVPTSVPTTMTVMKLPPLDTSASKSGSGRDLLCVGKD